MMIDAIPPLICFDRRSRIGKREKAQHSLRIGALWMASEAFLSAFPIDGADPGRPVVCLYVCLSALD